MIRELDKRLVKIVPSVRQLKHQQLEFYGFIHFTVNTFTDKEWGDGTESPEIFNPARLDAGQWARAAKDAGMRGLILTCKHHDGFCLWPSRYTSPSVALSPYKDGRGDVVREVSDACRKEGLAFGVYLSPWDRNHPSYGSGREYDDYFVGQLKELLQNYGEIFAVWFDGACGEGPNGKRQIYDWERYYEVIRRLQPQACISVCGPDVRWCGNEAGQTRDSEWSVVPARTADTEKIAENSQQKDEAEFRQRSISAQDMDLGSREILEGEEDLIWYPADVQRLHELGEYIRNTYRQNLADTARITCDSALPNHGVEGVRCDSYDTCLQTADGITACDLVLEWEQAVTINRVVLKEDLRYSQRIEKFVIEAWENDGFRSVCEGTTVGYKRIAVLKEIKTAILRIRILDARVAPVIAFLGVYGGIN